MAIISELSENQELIIKVEGRFDFSTLQAFQKAYEKPLEHPVKGYVVDLKKSDYLDSSALGVLLALRDHAGEKGKVRIIHCNPDVKKIFFITKLDELFSVE